MLFFWPGIGQFGKSVLSRPRALADFYWDGGYHFNLVPYPNNSGWSPSRRSSLIPVWAGSLLL